MLDLYILRPTGRACEMAPAGWLGWMVDQKYPSQSNATMCYEIQRVEFCLVDAVG